MSEAAAVLMDAAEVARRIDALAESIARQLEDDAVAVCLLTGGLWFAADLTRALHARGRNPTFDALWLASYGDETSSSGRCEVRADLQRPVEGRQVLVLDDVFDSGLSLREAHRHLTAAGARQILTAVFARKPWPEPRPLEPDFVGWEAPPRFLVGYGMDHRGRWRGFPGVAALD